METGPGRPRNTDLTDRQREILRLISQRKTNGEIAKPLGISLDCVKYHVREICDHAGVDTREEAAEWWRQQQGLRARFSLRRHWTGLPVAFRWAGGAAGAAAVAVVAIAIVLVAQTADADRHPVRIAYTLPIYENGPAEGDSAVPQPDRVELRTIDGDGGNEQTLTEADRFATLSWTADGRYLAALALPAGLGSSSLHIYDAHTGEHRVSGLDSFVTALTWDPGDELLYLFSMDHVYEVDTSGEILRDVPAEVPLGNLETSPILEWSPGGRYLLIQPANDLQIFDREALAVHEHSVAAALEPPAEWGEFEGSWLNATRWTGDEALEMQYLAGPGDDTGGAEWRVDATLANGDIEPQTEARQPEHLDNARDEWFDYAFPPRELEHGLPFDNYMRGCTPICTTASRDMYVVTVAHASASEPALEFGDGQPEEWPEDTRVSLAWLEDGDVTTLELPFQPRGQNTGVTRFHDLHGFLTATVHVTPED